MVSNDRWAVSQAEFGKAIGVSTKTIARKVALGEIAVIRMGRLVRIPVTEIDRLLTPKAP
jgi:excisionase family DNA binding protein